MTSTPVGSLHVALGMDAADLLSSIQNVKGGLGGLRQAFGSTAADAAKSGDKIDKGLGVVTAGSKALGVEFQRLQGRMDPLAAAFTKLDREATKLDSDLRRGVITADQHAAAMERLKERGLGALATEADRLRMKFDPLYASSKKYEAAVGELNRLLAIGAVTQKGYEASLERLNAELATGATAFGTAATQANRFNATAGTMSHQTGNIAAQFQDIGVQLAGGQSPFLIALQQGSQLTGVFGQMEGGVRGVAKGLGGALMSLVSPLSLITIGAIAAGGMLVQWLTSAGEEAKTLEKLMDELGASMDQYTEYVRTAATDTSELTEEFGKFAGQIRGFSEYLAGVALGQSMDDLRASLGKLQEPLTNLQDLVATAEMLEAQFERVKNQEGVGANLILAKEAMESARDSAAAAASALGLTVEQATELARRMNELGAAKTMEEIAAAAGSVLTYFKQIAANGVDLPAPLREAAVALEEIQKKAAEAANETQRLAGAAPGNGWMSGAINETNLLIGKLMEASRLKDRIDAIDAANVAGRIGDTDRGGQRDQRRSAGEFNSKQTMDRLFPEKKGGKSDAEKFLDDIKRLNQAAADGLTPLEKYRSGLAKLADMKAKGLSDAAYADGVRQLNEELANSNPLVNDLADAFGDFAASGFKDFEGFTKSINSMFTKMIADMIATAIRNKIMLNIGVTTSGGGGSVLGGNPFGNLNISPGLMLGGMAAFSIAGGLMLRRANKKAAAAEAAAARLAQQRDEAQQRRSAADKVDGEFNSLRTRESQLRGDIAALRARELNTLDPSNRALQERIWKLEDEQAVTAERTSLEEQLLQLQGDTAELRRRELMALDPSNRALQERISKLKDEQAVSTERKSLEEQLLQLQGNTTELRRRELNTLDPSNRALQESIWRLEDAAEAQRGLNAALADFAPEDFATALDYNRARGLLASGGPSAMVTPMTPAIAAQATQNAAQTQAQVERHDALLTSLNSNVALMWKTLQKFDYDGMPPVRT